MAKKITPQKLATYLDAASFDPDQKTHDMSAVVQFLIDLDLLNLERVDLAEEAPLDEIF